MAEQNINKPTRKRVSKKKIEDKPSVITLLKDASPEEIAALRQILGVSEPESEPEPTSEAPQDFLPRLNAAPPPINNELPRLTNQPPNIRSALQNNTPQTGRPSITKEIVGPRPNMFDQSPIKDQRKNLIKEDKKLIGDNEATPRAEAQQQYIIACEKCGRDFQVYAHEVPYIEGAYRYKCNGCLVGLVR